MSANAVLVLVMSIYMGGICLVIYAILRRRKRQADARGALLGSTLEAAGARAAGAGRAGGAFGSGERAWEIAGGRVLTSSQSVNRYYYKITLRADCGALPWITVYPEGAAQRFGKAIGLNREVQTGDQTFDDAAYLDTVEEEAPVQRVFEGAEVRAAILGLLALRYKVTLSANGLEAFRMFDHGTEPDLSGLQEAAALLVQAARALPRPEPGTFKGRIALLPLRALGLFFIWIPFVVVAGALDSALFAPGARTLTSGGKTLLVTLTGATAWLLFAALVTLWLRGRSYSLAVTAVTVLVALLGVPAAGLSLGLAANQIFDKSPAEPRAARVERNTQYRRECRVLVKSWLIKGHMERLPVHCEARKQYQTGDEVVLKVHPGWLGAAWVEPLAERR